MRTSFPLAFALLLTASTHVLAAGREPDPNAIDFHPIAPDSREMEIVNAKFPGVVTKDVKAYAAVVLLGTTKVASLIAKFVSPATCVRGDVDGACRTVVLVAGAQDWSVVLDRRSKDIEFGDVGFGAMKEIRLNHGYEVWTWTGTAYGVDVEKLGTPAKLVAAPTAARPLLLQQFGASIERLNAAKPNDLKVLIANVVLHQKTKQILVHVEGPGVCGIVLGCPWRVLESKGQKYETILDGYGTGKVAALPILRDGWNDIAFATPKGFVIYGWGGKSYAIADRSNDKGGK